ncbi:hypothetical protein BJ508DRAFT_380416 [Ascobolus immersus RN42]|uniref:Uncharacterized protein n=1 Tax=Ascobolus immersus RN42 TaxID=1160509 RepID=A0A3N4HM09_ASCIM|nr:hypothetical protein BJ508DRAFT_380416 [Ascobolus immersus RN42]
MLSSKYPSTTINIGGILQLLLTYSGCESSSVRKPAALLYPKRKAPEARSAHVSTSVQSTPSGTNPRPTSSIPSRRHRTMRHSRIHGRILPIRGGSTCCSRSRSFTGSSLAHFGADGFGDVEDLERLSERAEEGKDLRCEAHLAGELREGGIILEGVLRDKAGQLDKVPAPISSHHHYGLAGSMSKEGRTKLDRQPESLNSPSLLSSSSRSWQLNDIRQTTSRFRIEGLEVAQSASIGR